MPRFFTPIFTINHAARWNPTGRRFHLVLIGFPPPLDKLKFGEEKPSPLGKVAARRADGRGRYNVLCPQAFWRNGRNLFRPRLRSATFPKGEGFGFAKFQFFGLLTETEMHVHFLIRSSQGGEVPALFLNLFLYV